MGCEMVAAIFLDIDGVICCNLAGRLEESKLLALHEIVKATQDRPTIWIPVTDKAIEMASCK